MSQIIRYEVGTPLERGGCQCPLQNQLVSEQEAARQSLKIIFTSIEYLAQQGLALRGHCGERGNLLQLLKPCSCDCEQFKS